MKYKSNYIITYMQFEVFRILEARSKLKYI